MTVERLVFAIAGSMILASLVLTHFHSPNWMWLTAFVGANMLQAAFTGFCPLAKMLQAIGKKTGPAF